MSRLAYASSSGVHFPRRRGGPFFLELEDAAVLVLVLVVAEVAAGCRGGIGLEAGAATESLEDIAQVVHSPWDLHDGGILTFLKV